MDVGFFTETADRTMAIVTAVSWSIALIVICVSGIMLAAGSAKTKEAVKEKLPWIGIGIGLCVFAPQIINLVQYAVNYAG